jgi:cytolysin-activating lysine-acyltransferase
MTATPNAPSAPHDADLARIAEIARTQAKAVLAKLPALGPVAWLYMQLPGRKHAFLADLEWLAMPPLVLGQCKLYVRDEAPLAFASWAFLSADAAARYAATGRLAPADWKSGEEAWLVDLVAPFGGGERVLEDVRRSALAGRVLKQLVPAEGGGVRVLELK